EADRLRQIGGCTLLSAIVHPVRDCLDLLIREAAFTLKHAMSVDRLPWRHRLQEDSFPDRSRPRPRVRIGHQREGRDVAGPMACLTMLLKNADNLIVECCLAVGIRWARKYKKNEGQDGDSNAHDHVFYSMIAGNHESTFAVAAGAGCGASASQG